MYRFVNDVLLNPLVILWIVSVMGLVRLWWVSSCTAKRPWGMTLLFTCLSVCSTPAAAWWARGSLEWRNAAPVIEVTADRTILVLGGYLRPPNRQRREAQLGWDTLNRCRHVLQLRETLPGTRLIVVSGGKVDGTLPGPTLAEAMREFFRLYGVPEEQIVLEAKSTNTYENALESARLLQQRGIQKVTLVTDALHLERARRCLEKQGLVVELAGCEYQAEEFPWEWTAFVPQPAGAGDVQRVVHEWVGILWYTWKGWL